MMDIGVNILIQSRAENKSRASYFRIRAQAELERGVGEGVRLPLFVCNQSKRLS